MNSMRIGTRDSKLAMCQAEWVLSELSRVYPDLECVLIPIKTKGDKILDVALSKIGDKGLFTKELEHALLDDSIDIAVHSLKDLPTNLPPGLEIAAFCKREDHRDVLLSKNGLDLDQLPPGAVIGTSSLRRISQLKSYRPDLAFMDVRGNLETRWEKLQMLSMDALVLAAAGVIRLGWQDRITQIIPESIILPAVGQGSIAIEIAEHRQDLKEILSPLNDRPTELAVKAERSLMRTLQGGCQIPIAAFAEMTDSAIRLTAMVSSLDGSRLIRCQAEGRDPEQLGILVAEQLIKRGANEILAETR